MFCFAKEAYVYLSRDLAGLIEYELISFYLCSISFISDDENCSDESSANNRVVFNRTKIKVDQGLIPVEHLLKYIDSV